jgi:hypothetical protein
VPVHLATGSILLFGGSVFLPVPAIKMQELISAMKKNIRFI